MSFAEKHIIKTYSMLFNGLSPVSKIELIKSLTRALKKDKISKDAKFFKSFGAFSSEKSAQEIVFDIKNNRKFRGREITF